MDVLRPLAPALGMSADLGDLDVVQVRHGLRGRVTQLQQTLAGLPIHDAHVVVLQGPDQALRTLHTSYRSARRVLGADLPALDAGAATAAASQAVGLGSLRSPVQTRLVWFPRPVLLPRPEKMLVLAWEVTLPARVPLGDFRLLIDAATGQVLLRQNLIVFDTGTGLTHLPSPVQTSGDTSLADAGNANSPVLEAELVSTGLPGLDEGTGLLRGEFVDLVSVVGGLPLPHADEPTRVYAYDRSNPRFEEVVVYDAIDSVQRYVHALGFDDDVGVPNGIRDSPMWVSAHWFMNDQSFYSPSDDVLYFGDGGVDDAEDADIVIHEYAHAIQFDQKSCWGGGEMGAMGEGFGDYLAASFNAGNGEVGYQTAHAACVAEWDATSYRSTDPPCLRRVDEDWIYPDDLVGQAHADGLIWSRALWELNRAIGSSAADQLILEHHFSLPCAATMPDAAHEILDADSQLNGGAHDGTIRSVFCDRGILSGTDCLPAPSLSLSAQAAPAQAGPGTLVTYTLTATNQTGAVLTAVEVADVIPDRASYVPGSASHGGSAASGIVSWPPLSLGVAEPMVRSYQVVIDPGISGTQPVLVEDWEGGGGGWQISHGVGAVDWALGTANPHGGAQAFFAAEPSGPSDSYLALSSALTLPADAVLRFWHDYDTEDGLDGGVLEVSTDGSLWWDLGSVMVQGGYGGRISETDGSPIAGRRAFTGSSGGYVETVVDLSAFAGLAVEIRFRMASDASTGGLGWYVDDVEIVGEVRVEDDASVRAAEGPAGLARADVEVIGDPAACGDGIHQPGNLEACDDADADDEDGCTASCLIALRGRRVCEAAGASCSYANLGGMAEGGQVQLTVEGIALIVTTSAGQSAADVVAAIGQAINDDAGLRALGVLAEVGGGQVITTGDLTQLIPSDAGLSILTDPIPTFPGWAALITSAGLLYLLGRRLSPGRTRSHLAPVLGPDPDRR